MIYAAQLSYEDRSGNRSFGYRESGMHDVDFLLIAGGAAGHGKLTKHSVTVSGDTETEARENAQKHADFLSQQNSYRDSKGRVENLRAVG